MKNKHTYYPSYLQLVDFQGFAMLPCFPPIIRRLAPTTGAIAPTIGALARRAEAVAPTIGGLAPTTGAIARTIGAVARRAEALAPTIGGLAPTIRGLAPTVGAFARSIRCRRNRIRWNPTIVFRQAANTVRGASIILAFVQMLDTFPP
jgi:hypothetical protein